MVSPAYSADGRFKLLHDVYQSKTRSTSRTSPPARERSHERTPSPGDCASFGFQLESSSRPKAPLAAALAGSCGDTLLDLHSDGLLCDELCFLSRTAIGPPPNVTLAWVSLHLTMGDSSPPRVHSDNHVTKHTGRRVVFASSKKQTPVKGPSASDVGDHSCLGLEGLLLGWFSHKPSRERIPFYHALSNH